MIRFWEIERREEINITHKSLLRWNTVTNFYCFPLLSSYRQTRRNGDFQKHQYLDYQKINPLDAVKHSVKLLCDFSRSSSITKFVEIRDTQSINILINRWLPMCRETRRMGTRSIYSFPENNQHPDYRLVNPHDAVKHSTWVPRSVYSSEK